ncbi:MAG: ATP-binding protein [Gammaproteobacteria bacterium]|nr:ATP-binding protein [Gammaproteobacteria bacterium]
MYERLLERKVREALSDTPVVLVVGPRRAGKTTLVRKVGRMNRKYITLDDETMHDFAQFDPAGFVRDLNMATIDEVQRVPELILAIKKSVDEDLRPGRFLLTGSANLMTLPRVADSLAGRIEILEMLPLACSEIAGVEPAFLDRLFAGEFQGSGSSWVGDQLIQKVMAGGFPEALARPSERRRQNWAKSWMKSVLTRDLRDIAEIEKLAELPSFVRLLAEHSGNLINYSQLGAGIGVSYKTGCRYLRLLEQIFVVAALQPWHTNALKRTVKTPKLHFIDCALLAAASGLTVARLKANRGKLGGMLENYVFSELLKLTTVSDQQLTLYHFRDQQMREVGIVLERDDGMIAGVEVKASSTVRSSDFAGLKSLSVACGDRFSQGVVLYDGTEVVPFGGRMAAVPVSSLGK